MAASLSIERNARAAADGAQIITFRSGSERLSVAATEVREILRLPRVTRVPHASAHLCGVANLRGAVLPILSMAALLGQTTAASNGGRVLVIDREAPIGLLVDEILSISGADGVARALNLGELLSGSFVMADRPAIAAAARAATPQTPEPLVRTDDRLTLVSFAAGNQTYAIHLARTREILAVPADVLVTPKASDAASGVMPWRGRLLPLIDAEILLGLPANDVDQRKRRIMVIDSGGGTIGLVTRGIREILRVPPEHVDPVPAILIRGREETGVEGIARLDGGRRLVSILAAEKIFSGRNETLKSTGEADMTQQGSAASSERFLIFTLGPERYGLPIAAIDEIVRLPPALTRIPRAPAFIEGAMNLRGKAVPIVDQARRFGVAPADGAGSRRVIVVRIGTMQVGFAVDSVSEILSVSGDRLSPAPEFSESGSALFDRVLHRDNDGSILLLIDPQELLDRAEKDLVAALAEAPAQMSV